MNTSRVILCALFLLTLAACASSPSLPPGSPVQYVSSPVQCVPYARQVSGVQLYGDAYTWWNSARAHNYQCSQVPRVGAVLVLARTSQMSEGHVATVSGITNSRHITVNHSNWGDNRGRRKVIYYAMPVEDVSAKNDWTRVKFWNYEKNVYGFPYAAKGFIYP